MSNVHCWGELESVERELALALGALNGWGVRDFLGFANSWKSDFRAWFRGKEPLRGLGNRRGKRIQVELMELHRGGIEQALDEVRSWPGRSYLIGEQGYPGALQELDHPPAVVHLDGNASLLDELILAVVGSRKISGMAMRAAQEILKGAHREHVYLLSGGALGADTVAHRSSLDAQRPGLVVLPSGLERYTPRSNQRLFQEILAFGGLLVSEYHPKSEVRKFHFRRRNEVISALSSGVFVMRSGESSGTMLTVEAARRLGRSLGAMPGDPDDPLVYGCHQILREGGAYISSAEDLRGWVRQLAKKVPGPAEQISRTLAARRTGDGGGEVPRSSAPKNLPACKVLECALALQSGEGSFSIEELVRATERSPAEVQGLLLGHELSGYVVRCEGERFRVCR